MAKDPWNAHWWNHGCEEEAALAVMETKHLTAPAPAITLAGFIDNLPPAVN